MRLSTFPAYIVNRREQERRFDRQADIVVGGLQPLMYDRDPNRAEAVRNISSILAAAYPRKARDDNKIDPVVALVGNLSLQVRLKAERGKGLQRNRDPRKETYFMNSPQPAVASSLDPARRRLELISEIALRGASSEQVGYALQELPDSP